jgi:branched-chain amino acid transport system permease protein
VMALFGGIGQFYGPILGAVIITVLTDMVLVKFPLYNILLLGLIFIVVILFLPNGLVGLVRREGTGSGGKGFDVIRKRLGIKS